MGKGGGTETGEGEEGEYLDTMDARTSKIGIQIKPLALYKYVGLVLQGSVRVGQGRGLGKGGGRVGVGRGIQIL